MPTVKRPFTDQKTFYKRIVDGWNSLDSSLQIINIIMVCVKSQDVKLKRMKYHDPFLWGNVLKGLYSLLMKSLVLYSQYQFTLLNCTRVVPEKSKIRKGKKPGRNLLTHKCPFGFMLGNRRISHNFHQRALTRWMIRYE